MKVTIKLKKTENARKKETAKTEANQIKTERK